MDSCTDQSYISERIKSIRTSRGLKGREVAEGIGIKPENYRKYETSIMPGVDVVLKLADFYAVSLDSLLGRSENASQEILDPVYQTADTEREKATESLKNFDVDYNVLDNDLGELSAMEILVISRLRSMDSKERMKIIDLITNKQ